MRELTTRRRQTFPGALLAVMIFIGPAAALAHEGPPFPILMDKPVSDYIVSVWADPDIGEAQFYIIVEGPEGGPPRQIPKVSMWVEPLSRRLDRVNYEATEQSLRNQLKFEARPSFDQRDQWTVGFQITAPGKEPQELATQVESTPPGYGLWDFVIYLFPFVFLGAFWVVALRRRSRLRQLPAAEQTDQTKRLTVPSAKDETA